MNLSFEDLNRKNIFNILKMTKSLIRNTDVYDKYIESVPNISTKEKKLILPKIYSNRHHFLSKNDSYLPINSEPSNTEALEKYFRVREKMNNNKKGNFNINTNSLRISKQNMISSLDLYFDIDIAKYTIDKSLLKDTTDPEKILFLVKMLENRQNSIAINKKIEKRLTSQGKTLKLEMNSLKVKLINSHNSVISDVYIPFIYLPIFFAFPMEDIQLFLSQSLVFSEQNKPNSLCFKSDLLLSALKAKLKENYQIKCFNNKLIHHPFEFKLDWITETETFSLIVQFPKVEFELEQSDLKLTKFIDFKILLYLIENDSKEWEYYLLSYLNNFSMFRKCVKKSFSLYLSVNKGSRDEVDLDKDVKSLYTDEQSKYYTFFLTKKTTTTFNKVGMYSLTSVCLSTEISANFSFSIQQSRIIENVKNYAKANVFFKRFINIDSNSNTITLDVDLFNRYNEKSLLNSVQKFKMNYDDSSKNKEINIKFT